ncbi:hypothetical protein RAA17_21965 [Komagataeibacter rhaeticus]|nr:hypothetical protein [Komagataeibacter rhaeticus]
MRDYRPDVVLVDMNRADRDALDSIRALSRSALERPVALFVDEDDVELMETAFDTGICSYNVLEALPRDVKPLLRAAIALYARFRRTRDELSEAQRVLAERGIIEQAKRCFMKNEKPARRRPIGGCSGGPCRPRAGSWPWPRHIWRRRKG